MSRSGGERRQGKLERQRGNGGGAEGKVKGGEIVF